MILVVTRVYRPVCTEMFVLFAIFIVHSRESELYRYTLDGKSALAWELPNVYNFFAVLTKKRNVKLPLIIWTKYQPNNRQNINSYMFLLEKF